MTTATERARLRNRLAVIGRKLARTETRGHELREERDEAIREAAKLMTVREIESVEGMPTYERIRQLLNERGK